VAVGRQVLGVIVLVEPAVADAQIGARLVARRGAAGRRQLGEHGGVGWRRRGGGLRLAAATARDGQAGDEEREAETEAERHRPPG
jgi:hypothetical protein